MKQQQHSRLLLLVAFSFFITLVSSGPANGHKGTKKLSDQEHYNEVRGHNSQFDHEAFLGKEQAKTFSELPPEEAKRRLEVIVDKIDTNNDGRVTEEELTDWVRHVSRRYVFDDRDRHWDHHVKDGRQQLSWEDYLKRSYGMVEDRNKIHDHGRNLTYNDVIARYEKRFQLADTDRNNLLNKEEFADFLHPHDVPSMKSVVIDETFQDIDKNRDGRITMDEYLDDLRNSYDSEDDSWREAEIKLFRTHRDKDNNGFLDKNEIEHWLYPPNVDPCVNEARHLIYHADIDEDQILSKKEILDQQDLFVGSQATEHGKFFLRHDEF